MLRAACFLPLCLALAACSGSGGDDPTPDAGPHIPQYPGDVSLPEAYRPSGDEFMVAFIPDSQIYARDYPETFESQMRWLAENAAELDIVFVSHVGDIVQNGGASAQWAVARASYDWLEDEGVPHGLAIASHDTTDDGERFNDYGTEEERGCGDAPRSVECVSPGFVENFAEARFEDEAWYRGSSPSGRSSYQIIEAGGMELLFLHVFTTHPEEEMTWANEVLDAHPTALAHITTHKYIFDYRLTYALPTPLNLLPSGRFTPLAEALTSGEGLGGSDPDQVTADDFFRDVVAAHPNVWGVHCGHVDGEFRQISRNVAGLPVHEVLIDYQNMADGGGGWLRLLRFKPSEDEVEAITFSTLTGEVRADGDGFEHAIMILGDYKDRAADALEEFGLTEEDLDELLRQVQMEGEFRDEYRESLDYGFSRESAFVMEVDFDAYTTAAQ